jgi:polar amino acid transport system permease protein
MGTSDLWANAHAKAVWPLLLEGLQFTVKISLAGFALAVVLGLFVAVVRRAHIPVLSPAFTFYVQFVRGTPLLVQAMFAVFVLPTFGPQFSFFVTGVLVMGINYSAYCAEVFRAGIEDVPVGQWEASTALSLSRVNTWRRIILPQTVRRVIPILGNYLIQMFKDTAVLHGVAMADMMHMAMVYGQDHYRYNEALLLVALLYLAISIPASIAFRVLERRFAVNA